MHKDVVKAMRHDCHKYMWGSYILYALREIFSLVLPTIIAWLVGDMTNSLLSLDKVAIQQRLVPFLLAIILEVFVSKTEDLFTDMVIIREAANYQSKLLERCMRRPLASLQKETGATIAEHLMNDIPEYYFNQIIKMTSWVIYVCYLVALSLVLWKERLHPIYVGALFLLGTIPLWKSVFLAKKQARYAAEEREYRIRRTQEEHNLFRGRTFFRLNHLEDMEVKKMQDDFARFFSETGRKNCSLTATAEVFSYLSVYGGPLVLILTGALLVYAGQMSVGALMAGYLIFPTISAFYKKISMQMDEKKMEKDIEERIQVFYGNVREDLMEIENVDSSKALLGVEQISFQNVSFTYPENNEYTIRNWNGEFDKTKFVRIAGENGSGKSTLLMLLAGLYEPDEGCIQNEEGEVITKDKLRDLVAYQEQNAHLFKGTVWDNLFATEDKRELAEQLLNQLGCDKDSNFEVEACGVNLSPGERRKVALVRTLLKDAAFLVLDEPFNHLDKKGCDALMEILSHRRGGIIYVSHQDLVREGNMSTVFFL